VAPITLHMLVQRVFDNWTALRIAVRDVRHFSLHIVVAVAAIRVHMSLLCMPPLSLSSL
jgi:hypothetical protein